MSAVRAGSVLTDIAPLELARGAIDVGATMRKESERKQTSCSNAIAPTVVHTASVKMPSIKGQGGDSRANTANVLQGRCSCRECALSRNRAVALSPAEI